MSDNEALSSVTDTQNWVSTLFEGGLPQVLAGPAGKAVSRLVGAGVEIPAAYLEALAQDVRDRTEARSAVTQALAEHAKKQLIGDPAVMERAMNTMLSRSYRAQRNREAVVQIALNDLSRKPASADSEGPTEDWLSKFERYAEDASGDDVRLMFGKLLAEEIREPGKIASATLRFVSELDSDVARLAKAALSFCTSKGEAFLDMPSPRMSTGNMLFVAQSGFWTYEHTLMFDASVNEKNIASILLREDLVAEISVRNARKVSFTSAVLTKPGRDLLSITEEPFDVKSFVKLAHEEPCVEEVLIRRRLKTATGWQFVD